MRAWTAAALAALATLLLAATPAGGRVEGPCRILIQGEDVSAEGATVDVAQGGNVSYRITSPVPVQRWRMDLHYGPLTIPVFDRSYDTTLGSLEQAGNFSIADHTRYGTGLYEVSGQADLADGGRCDASLRMRVEGSPFGSVLGLAAVALVGVGGVGILAIVLQAALDANDVREAVADFLKEKRGALQPAATATAATAAATRAASDEEEGDPGAGPPEADAPEDVEE